MQRIDSINARPNQNGPGKAGFHDNADLNGQDATYLTPLWFNTIQEEIANVVENFGQILQPNNNQQLFEVIKNIFDTVSELDQSINQKLDHLKDRLDNLQFIAVGDLYITTINFSTSSEVAAHQGYGNWVLYGDGQALVTVASQNNTDAPNFMHTLGNEGGNYEHVLTVDELPNFMLKNGMLDDAQGDASGHIYGYTQEDCPGLAVGRTETSDGTAAGWQGYTSSIGEDKAHSIVQSSITIAAWRRIL